MYRILISFPLSLALLMLAGCGGDGSTSATENTAPANACVDKLEEESGLRLNIRECREMCEAEESDPISCGALALAHLKSLTAEIAPYAALLRPRQSPSEAISTMGGELQAELSLSNMETASTDIGMYVDLVLRRVITDLRGIRDGVHGFIDSDVDAEIPIDKLPLPTGLLAILYEDPNSLAVHGSWTPKEMAALGAVANSLLVAVDLFYSHNLRVHLPDDLPDFSSVAGALDAAIKVLHESEDFLTLADQERLAAARDELDAAFSLLAGRSETKEGVAQANPGLLGMIEAEMARGSKTHSGREPVLQIRDIDGDGRLSRGDALKFTLLVNDEKVEFALPYPISAALTEVVFDFIAAARDNMDGSETPVRIAPVVDSALIEFSGFFSTIRTFPDAVALDWNTFFAEFSGVRGLLPYWYQDKATDSSVNPYYFDGVTNEVQYYMAYEEQVGDDRAHFEWYDTAESEEFSWLEFAGADPGPEKIEADGIEVTPTAYYILLQSPALDGLLRTNTTPFINSRYDMEGDLDTAAAFEHPDNRTVNAVMNAFILWSQD